MSTATRVPRGWEASAHGFRRPAKSGHATSLVVLLHGVGSNAADLLPLAEAWVDAMPNTAFASFDGAEAFAGGFGGRQWFSLQDVTEASRVTRVAAGYPALAAMLQAELAFWQLDAEHLGLVGFSQGTMMALHHAVVDPGGVAVVVGYSGRLSSTLQGGAAVATSTPGRPVESLPARLPPITLLHGTADPVIPIADMERADALLRKAGYTVRSHALAGLTHTISGEGVAIGLKALLEVLKD
jgi:phospholipase/carboxylesterase